MVRVSICLCNIEVGDASGFLGLLTDEGGGEAKRPPPPKICHTYPVMMKFGTVIPYLKKVQKIYKSWETPLEFY